MPAQKPNFLSDYPYDDGFLWNQLKNGEKEGLEKIYTKYSKELFRYGMAIKPNRCFIKDCIQELFVDLWKYREKIRKTDNVKVYLLKSLSNKISKEISKEKRIFRSDEISVYETVFLEESAEEKLINLQRNEYIQVRLDVALGKLPIRQREVIQLLFFEKLSYEDISGILGITIESSYTLAWKAISRMKKSILIAMLILSIFK
ncbi:MAG TPA: sigma-70 family RNA polymerase sigma factor [Algoriphagus sp.]|nr:sigma-70 family RNA polymerase sigma factor [Algoriphagus sp.]